MRATLLTAVAALLLSGAAGCNSLADVPTSLEPIYFFCRDHSLACWEYPYSCPPCPYYDYQRCFWRYPWPLNPPRPVTPANLSADAAEGAPAVVPPAPQP